MSKLNNKVVLKYDSYNNIKSKLKRLKAINKYQKQMKETLTTHKDRRKKFKHGLILRMKDATKIDITKYIIKLEIYYEDTDTGGYGTGNIITVNNNSIYVLTAAHNVVTYDEWYNEWIDASVIAFKYNNKEFVGKASYTCPTYKSKFSKSEYNDIAIIVFENKEATFDNFTLLSCVVSDKEYSNIETFNGYILGYPGEYHDNIIWGMKGEIKSKKSDNKLCYKIDTTPGQSGSLIFGEIKRNVYGIMGIHTDGDFITKTNCGTKISGTKTLWIRDTIFRDVMDDDRKIPEYNWDPNSTKSTSKSPRTVHINQIKTDSVVIEALKGTPTGSSKSKRLPTPKASEYTDEEKIPTLKLSDYKTNTDWKLVIESVLKCIEDDDDKITILEQYETTAENLLQKDNKYKTLYLPDESFKKYFHNINGGYRFLNALGYKRVTGNCLKCYNVNKDNILAALQCITKITKELKKKRHNSMTMYDKPQSPSSPSISPPLLPSINNWVNSNSMYNQYNTPSQHGYGKSVTPNALPNDYYNSMGNWLYQSQPQLHQYTNKSHSPMNQYTHSTNKSQPQLNQYINNYNNNNNFKPNIVHTPNGIGNTFWQPPSISPANSSSTKLFEDYQGQTKSVSLNRNGYHNNRVFNPNIVSLPKGWGKGISNDGTPYYYNHKNKRSYWMHPCNPEFPKNI